MMGTSRIVLEKGLEPSRLAAPAPKAGVYTNFTTPAFLSICIDFPPQTGPPWAENSYTLRYLVLNQACLPIPPPRLIRHDFNVGEHAQQ